MDVSAHPDVRVSSISMFLDGLLHPLVVRAADDSGMGQSRYHSRSGYTRTWEEGIRVSLPLPTVASLPATDQHGAEVWRRGAGPLLHALE